MDWQSWHILLGPAFALPFLAFRAEKMFRALPQLPSDLTTSGPFPSLSIIVPARNEEANLQRLLPSLRAIDYPGPVEVLVVDDNSTDRTACVAQALGAQVMCAGELPPGWLGKPHACHRAAERAQGEWLLFTDADTIHTPAGPRLAMAYALAYRLDGVSLFLQHETFGLMDRLALLAAFAGLYAGLQPGHPLLNGQYLLLRRETYFQSGGFAAVRSEPLEDLALAHLLKNQSFCVTLLRGEAAGRVQMYQDLRHLWQGMTRIGAGSLKWGGLGGMLTALYVTGALAPILAIPASLFSGMPLAWVLVLWGLSIGVLMPWGVRFGSWRLGLLAPFGALFVQVAAVRGLVGKWLGRGVTWKGRVV